MDCENKTVLDFNEYQDIDLEEFITWLKEKYFKRIIINNDRNWYKNKYDVDWLFYRDYENKKLSIELKLVDVTDYPPDPCIEELLKELEEEDKIK